MEPSRYRSTAPHSPRSLSRADAGVLRRWDGQRPTPFECVSRRCNTPYSPYYFRPQPVRRAVLAPGARLGASTSGHVGRGRRGWPQDAACYRERENLRAYCQGGTLQVGHTGGGPGPHPLGSLCPLRSAYQWSGVGADSCSCPAHSSICVNPPARPVYIEGGTTRMWGPRACARAMLVVGLAPDPPRDAGTEAGSVAPVCVCDVRVRV